MLTAKITLLKLISTTISTSYANLAKYTMGDDSLALWLCGMLRRRIRRERNLKAYRLVLKPFTPIFAAVSPTFYIEYSSLTMHVDLCSFSYVPSFTSKLPPACLGWHADTRVLGLMTECRTFPLDISSPKHLPLTQTINLTLTLTITLILTLITPLLTLTLTAGYRGKWPSGNCPGELPVCHLYPLRRYETRYQIAKIKWFGVIRGTQCHWK